ncbi:MAG TPA: hypothetical protein VFU76_15085 [Terriglobales bacterium]|nr:hypothetical protein [Terriglobales bacterium]
MSAVQRIRSFVLDSPWRLWTRQMLAVVRMELKKSVITRRGLWIYLLAFAPVAIIGLHALDMKLRLAHPGSRVHESLSEDTQVLAGIFQFYYLRMGIFFGCMGIFTWLLRGEYVEKTLHYYLLAPIRRELMVLGKFVAGLLTSTLLFATGVLLSFALMYWGLGGEGEQFVFAGPGLGHLGAYLLVTALACVGYGALFMMLSMLLKNPIVPGIILLGWEGISPVFPQAMQKLSVTFYLKHLTPVAVRAEGLMALFTVVTDPVPKWLAVFGLLALSSFVVFLACLKARTLQVSYHTE